MKMKTKWKITSFAMIAMLISCGGGTNEQNNTAETTEESTPQMTTYDSPNSLYSISVPNEYEQKNTNNVGNLLFQNQDNGVILTKMYGDVTAEAFHAYVKETPSTMPDRYHYNLIEENDSLAEYRITSGLFIMHQFIMWKKGAKYDYFIEASAPSMDKDLALSIYESLQEK